MVNRNKLIIVLGMHRSGTSVISRGLQVMGVELGNRLMAPVPDVNAKGFWEDVDLNLLNIEMLHAIGSEWHNLRPISAPDVENLREKGFFQQAVDLIRLKVSDAPIFGFKDPRVSKLLPFWKEVLDHCHFDVRYAIAIRHPLSVVKSLEKRDGLSRIKSYTLWLEHVVVSMAETAGSKRVIVDYDNLMNDTEHELIRIADNLDLSVDPERLLCYKTQFIDETLRHSIHDSKDLLNDSSCPQTVREMYETLKQVAADTVRDDHLLQEMFYNWQSEFSRSVPLLELVDEFASKNESLAQNLMKHESLITDLVQDVDECESKLMSVDENIATLESENDALKLDMVIYECRVGELVNENAEKDRYIEEGNSVIADLKGDLAKMRKQITELNDETVRRGEWALGLDAQLKDARKYIESISNSNSWRITFPLREAGQWMRSPSSQARRYFRGAVSYSKGIYKRLPLSVEVRILVRRLVSRHAPWALHDVSVQPDAGLPAHSATISNLTISDPEATARSICLSTSEQPLVSIIIPVYGQCQYTLKCLLSIASNTPLAPYEVIVIDDKSPDDSFVVLGLINGINLIQNQVNLGFIRSCNAGASVATGQYLYFLNNDTQVTAGWLDELVRTFVDFPGTGLAGSKLVYPDGSLQEAGGIIWQDGSAWNFGRNQDPLLPVFNYAREVDYCSGASIMVPKALFHELGGFDEHYLPAYCEDADLALKIRKLGLRVIYQPLSVVTHYEGVTSGTETSGGVKAYQIENSRKLYERWRTLLQEQQISGDDVDGAKDRCATNRVLVLDHCTPTPNQDAGSVTVFNMLLLLREMNLQVTFIPEDNFLYMREYTTALQRLGVEVLYAPYVTSVVQHVKDSGKRYDLVLLFRPGVVERHLDTIRKHCDGARVLYHTVDLHFLRMSREAELHRDAAKSREATQMKHSELSAIRAVDASIVHSTAELELLRLDLPDERIYVYPLILNVSGSDAGYSERKDIVFVGGYQHAPNVDAVLYFVDEIMPLLRKHLPGIRFHAVGSSPPDEILSLESEDVVIAGFVDDLSSLLNKMRVSVAPLRYGAGIKGKIGTAMAVGLPIVSTTIAAEGMSLTNGEDILVADGAEEFASAVIRLYEDEVLWHAISQASIKFADSAWGAESAYRILHTILSDMGIQTTRYDRPLKLYS